MTDFIVIGGGVAGISAAAQLSELGTVTVLEMEDALGYHASGRSAAMFEQDYGSTSTVALSRASADHHRNANGGYLTPRGLLMVAKADQIQEFEHDINALDLQEISLDEAVTQVPILNLETAIRAAHHDTAQDIDTDRLIQDYAKVLRANGGQVVTKATVTAISQTDGGWQVTAGGTAFDCKQWSMLLALGWTKSPKWQVFPPSAFSPCAALWPDCLSLVATMSAAGPC